MPNDTPQKPNQEQDQKPKALSKKGSGASGPRYPKTKKETQAYAEALHSLYGKTQPEVSLEDKSAVTAKFGVLRGGKTRLPRDKFALQEMAPGNDDATAQEQDKSPNVVHSIAAGHKRSPDEHESVGRQQHSSIPEWREQANFVEWLHWKMPHTRGYVVKIDNEGQRTYQAAQTARMMGLCQGAHDMLLARPALGFHGLWLEFKKNQYYPPSSRATPSWRGQEDFKERMISVGYAARFAYGCDHAIEIVQDYFGIVDNGK